MQGQSSYFVWLNRGKHSVVLDLTQAQARDDLSALLSGADVLVQNLKPGALDKLGFGPKALSERHPSLVICSISGYGEDGPFATRKAYDLLVQAESGLCSVTGGPDEPPAHFHRRHCDRRNCLCGAFWLRRRSTGQGSIHARRSRV
jgi:formyl-CoA transferase